VEGRKGNWWLKKDQQLRPREDREFGPERADAGEGKGLGCLWVLSRKKGFPVLEVEEEERLRLEGGEQRGDPMPQKKRNGHAVCLNDQRGEIDS